MPSSLEISMWVKFLKYVASFLSLLKIWVSKSHKYKTISDLKVKIPTFSTYLHHFVGINMEISKYFPVQHKIPKWS